MESPIVTLTTDWGYHDFFAGMVKGKLYSYIPNVRVVDITHGLEPFQIAKAIFVVKNACMGFPEGTIHIIDNNSSQSLENPFVVVKFRGQYYICIDNGLPKAVFGSEAEEAVLVDVHDESSFHTFAANDLFCKVAAMLAHGATLADIGNPIEEFCQYTPINTLITDEMIKVYVAYIDSYGNADLNITYEEFDKLCAQRDFIMYVRDAVFERIVHNYIDVPKDSRGRDRLLLTVSSTGHLQIAMREASAQQFLGLQLFESVIIKFWKKKQMGKQI